MIGGGGRCGLYCKQKALFSSRGKREREREGILYYRQYFCGLIEYEIVSVMKATLLMEAGSPLASLRKRDTLISSLSTSVSSRSQIEDMVTDQPASSSNNVRERERE